MTLKSIAADIERYASDELKVQKLKVVIRPAEELDVEDDEIVLTLAGRELTTHLQVSSLSSGSWADVLITTNVYKQKALGKTGLIHMEFEGVRPIMLGGSAKNCVAALMQEVRRTDYAVEPVDDLQGKIITDIRMPGIVETLEKVQEALAGKTEIRFSSSNGVIDQVDLLCDDVEFVRVKLDKYSATVTNVLRNEEQDVSGLSAIQQAITDLAYASYSAAP